MQIKRKISNDIFSINSNLGFDLIKEIWYISLKYIVIINIKSYNCIFDDISYNLFFNMF